MFLRENAVVTVEIITFIEENPLIKGHLFMQIGHRKEFLSKRLKREHFVRANERRVNARRVSLETLCGGHFTLSTPSIKPNNMVCITFI